MRDWDAYAKRTVAVAFGVPGDRLAEHLRRQDDRLRHSKGAIAMSQNGYRGAARSPDLDSDAKSVTTVPSAGPHLRRAIGEYLEHYHGERNQQGLDNVLLNRTPTPANENGRVLRRERLGGVLNYYHRNAA